MDETDILLVDDEPKVREFLAKALTQRGFACRHAADGDSAVDEVSRRRPALVVTDLRMPGRDGRWLLGELKRRWPELPVIMLTGDSDAQTAVQCLKDGADDYLVKPVNLEELGIAVRRAREKVRLVNETREQREHLEIARTQSERLQDAFRVIETTYRDTIGALLRAEGRSPASGAAGNERSEPAEAATDLSTEPKPRNDREASRAVDLSGLRVAGRLIGDGAAFVDVGSAIASELVAHDGLSAVRIWTHPEHEEDLRPLVDVGDGALPDRDPVDRTFSSARIERIDANDFTSLTCPILVNGAPRAVLQLVAPSKMSVDLVQTAERLSLVLAASLARDHDARESRRTAEELDLLYELASASRYSLDLEHVAEFLLESLDRVVDYDVACLLLLDENASLGIHTRFPADDGFIHRVREHVLTNLKLTCGVEPPGDLAVRIRGVDSAPERVAPVKLRSFVNVPLTVGGSVAGLVYVGSGRDRAFTDGEIRFVHRAADFLATSVQGVRDLVATLKSRIEQMVDHMTDGVLMLDRRGSVVAMNRAARDALKREGDSEQPLNASQLSQLLDFDPLELMKTQRRSLRKVVCVRGVPYQTQVSPVVGDDGDMVGAVLAFRNFQQEQKLDEMKDELVNVVSHELRTPLTAIKNALSLLRGKRLGALNHQQEHFIRLAERNAEQLVDIINDLLDLSKLEAGKMQIHLEPLSLAKPISDALSSLEPQAEAKGVSLESTIEADLPTVHGDAASLQRVLVNLVGNAIKFTESGGRVSVEAVTVQGESGSASGRGVKVTVSDSGVGIPGDQLESIFDKFNQVQGGNRLTTTAGTGLGLPICRELVKAHHGRIWAESDEGHGSRFSFVLPLLDDGELMSRGLDADIARAREEGTSIVVAILSIRTNGSSSSAPGAPGAPGADGEGVPLEALRDVVDVVKGVARRSADRVFVIRSKSQIAIVLPRTTGEGGSVFQERLAQALRESNVVKGKCSVGLGSALFPDDGDTAESLYSRAEAALEVSALA